MASVLLTRKGIVLVGDVRDIPDGHGYFIPSLSPADTEADLRKVLPGRWRYVHCVYKSTLGVLIRPITARGKPADKPEPAQSVGAPAPE